ncbi:hypothetical protein C8Q77DRAFT_1218969 [Trametes polyzona]|nr:hypothetical protein C8Q77DRAFT_1218969 [Trametes polyzona]
MASHGLHVLQDSGAPGDSTDYTTLVVVHGYTWSSGTYSGIRAQRTFLQLVPLAKQHNARVVLVNRRDYPGARPYTEEERALLRSSTADEGEPGSPGIAEASGAIETFMRDRTREVYGFLVEFVTKERPPPPQPGSNTGGIVIAGWSFGTIWMTALLAHVSSFDAHSIDVSAYMRRVVLFDPSYSLLGYHPPTTPWYHPLTDPLLDHDGRVKVFPAWASGYYSHGDTLETLEQKTPLRDPPPTTETLTPEELASMEYLPPGGSDGSDALLMRRGRDSGLFKSLKERAFYPERQEVAEGNTSGWPNVELCYVYCQRSVWEVMWGTWALRKEVEDGKQKGSRIRPIKLVEIKNANHFAPWDMPEQTLRALIGDETSV